MSVDGRKIGGRLPQEQEHDTKKGKLPKELPQSIPENWKECELSA